MSEYPRVADHERDVWYKDALGTHKVVPADAIVIERSELPEVRVEDGGDIRAGDSIVGLGCTAERALGYALGSLAISEHLRARPPVDEAEVEYVRSLLADIPGVAPVDAPYIARQLVVHGGLRGPERAS